MAAGGANTPGIDTLLLDLVRVMRAAWCTIIVPLLHDNIFAPFEALPSQMTTKCRTAFALAMSWATRVRQAALARHVWAAPATRHLQSIALLSLRCLTAFTLEGSRTGPAFTF